MSQLKGTNPPIQNSNNQGQGQGQQGQGQGQGQQGQAQGQGQGQGQGRISYGQIQNQNQGQSLNAIHANHGYEISNESINVGGGDGGENNEPSNNPEKKKAPRYSSERVIGSGSFGVVYKAISLITKESVAIKKVKEDRRYKNRELQMMKMVKHPNIVMLKDCFYSRINRDIYLNLVMEYIPETLYVTIRNHAKAGQTIPYIFTKLYTYQICRALAYCHSQGICHRDIKPQNLLLNPDTHTVKLCDFGSAKKLKEGEPNVAYICSRYYRAPELIFESSFYQTTIDTWSMGCVMGELFLTTPLFQGERSVDQLVEIIKVLGTPTRREIMAMNPNYTYTNFPAVKALPWRVVFSGVAYDNQPIPDDAIDILSKFLVYTPSERLDIFDALAHPYFDELREPDLEIPGCKKGPNLFNFEKDEIELATQRKIVHTIVPRRYWEQHGLKPKKHSAIGTTLNTTKMNDETKPTTGTAPSEKEYVLSRVQELADQRQEQEKKSLQKKPM